MEKHVKEEPEFHLKLVNESLVVMKKQVDINTKNLDEQIDKLATVEVSYCWLKN